LPGYDKVGAKATYHGNVILSNSITAGYYQCRVPVSYAIIDAEGGGDLALTELNVGLYTGNTSRGDFRFQVCYTR